MWNQNRSVKLSLAVCIAFCVGLTAALFAGPWVVKLWFHSYRGWGENSEALSRMLKLFKLTFYPCSVFGYVTLFSLISLLKNIKKGIVFTTSNVRHLRRISWCCIIVCLITLTAGVQYVPFLFVSVAAGFVGLMLRVVKNVMENAVHLKEENELTI